MATANAPASTSSQQRGALSYWLYDIWDEFGAPNTTDYFWLRGGPWKTWLATIGYLYIVFIAGPRFMSSRPAYSLKWPIRVYNAVLVAINLFLFVNLMHSYNFGTGVWGCGSALSFVEGRHLLKYGNYFFHCRYLEFFDTFFFILRKKTSQISFLHVYHHAIVPTLMYVGLKFYPIPFNSLLPITNTFVHIVMYGYYALATYPSLHKYLWWKRYLTTMQISQFVILLISCVQPLVLRGDTCKFPLGVVLINTFIGLSFLLLFLSFYKTTYLRAAAIKASTVTSNNNNNQIKNKLLNFSSSNNHNNTNLTATSTMTLTRQSISDLSSLSCNNKTRTD